MARTVEKFARHVVLCRILVDGVQVGIAELRRPMRAEPMIQLRLDPRDRDIAQIAERVEPITRAGIRRADAPGRRGGIHPQIQIVPAEIVRQIVLDAVVKDAHARKGVLRFPLEGQRQICGFLRPQIRVADPVPAGRMLAHCRIHLPVVVELTHARLCIARSQIHLEAAVGIAADIVRHADARRDMAAEKTAVIEAHDGRKNGIAVILPCIQQIRMPFLDLRLADGQRVLPGVELLLVAESVDAGKVRNQRIIPEFIGVIYTADAQCRERIGDFCTGRFVDDRDMIARPQHIARLYFLVVFQIRRPAVLVCLIPVHIAVCIAVELIIVDVGLPIRRNPRSARHRLMPKIRVIIVRSDFFLIRRGGILNARAFAALIGVAKSDGQKMVVIDRRIDFRVQMPLLMFHIIQGKQHIVSRILRAFRQG